MGFCRIISIVSYLSCPKQEIQVLTDVMPKLAMKGNFIRYYLIAAVHIL